MVSYIVGGLMLLVFGLIAYKGIVNMKNGKSGCHSRGCSGCDSSKGCPVMEQYNKNNNNME